LSPELPRSSPPPLGRVIAAFLIVYIVWGSTYLGIAVAGRSLPPFVLGSLRFLIAGGVLYAFARARGAARPTLTHWRSSAIIGTLLLTCGNGGVVWAVHGGRVPSGAASLMIATIPLWFVLVEWFRPGGRRPTARLLGGVAVGFVGLAVLIDPGKLSGAGRIDPLGAAVLASGSLCWAIGSVYSRLMKLPSSGPLATAMQMLCGGAVLAALAWAHGDLREFTFASVTRESWLALAYLIIFGSLIAFTAYVWLLQVAAPARVATYAYVNPIVAVFLGWLLGGEPFTSRMALAAAIIVAAVAFITSAPRQPAPRVEPVDARRKDSPAPAAAELAPPPVVAVRPIAKETTSALADAGSIPVESGC